MAFFSSLPYELVVDILCYLPIQSLLDFGLTSSHNRKLQQCSLSDLRLGVLNSKLYATNSLAESKSYGNCPYNVQIIVPRKELRNKGYLIYLQNQRIQNAVQIYRHSLRVLEITLWEFKESTAKVLAQLWNLKHLSICLNRSHSKYSSQKQGSRQNYPGSTVWNSLASKAGTSSVLGRLNSLRLECADITDYQLRRILAGNPRIRELRLHQCLNLTRETFRYLAISHFAPLLEILYFTEVNNEHIDDRVLKYVGRLLKLKVMSVPHPRTLSSI